MKLKLSSKPAMQRLANVGSVWLFVFVSLLLPQRVDAQAPAAESLTQVKIIDSALEKQWADYELTPAADESDAKWCRRVHLDLIGRIPSYAELQDFVTNKSKNKRAELVDQLLEDPEYTEEFANHWATVWSNILIGRSGGNDRRSLTSREGMAKYLRDSFARNKPYDKMVYELISATGTSKPGTENFNGATNFLAEKVNDENGTLATASTARIFLGQQVQCTQCHNHPFNQWKQQKFWELNAFFRQTRALRRFEEGTRDIDFIELVDEDYAGQSRRPQEADIFYEERNGLVRVAFPVFIDGTAIDRSGYVLQTNRRKELAKLIADSNELSRMMVNRTWAHFLGMGFTRPVDDLGPHMTISHPELLSQLAEEFEKSSFDMRELMRWIVLSKPYQLSSRITSGNEADDPASGEMPQFSRFYMRQMTAEQLYESLVRIGAAQGSLEEQQREKDRWLQQFVTAFGNDEGDESTTFNGSIPQVLMMFNGELVNRATSTEQGSWLTQLNSSSPRFNEKVRTLFLVGLARAPEGKEQSAANLLLTARNGNQVEALQDLWWAILNSNEFIMIQ